MASIRKPKYWDNGKEDGNYCNGLYRGDIGLYWAYVGIMEKKMEATIMGSQKLRRPDKSQKTTESEMEVRLLGFPIRLW